MSDFTPGDMVECTTFIFTEISKGEVLEVLGVFETSLSFENKSGGTYGFSIQYFKHAKTITPLKLTKDVRLKIHDLERQIIVLQIEIDRLVGAA